MQDLRGSGVCQTETWVIPTDAAQQQWGSLGARPSTGGLEESMHQTPGVVAEGKGPWVKGRSRREAWAKHVDKEEVQQEGRNHVC